MCTFPGTEIVFNIEVVYLYMALNHLSNFSSALSYLIHQNITLCFHVMLTYLAFSFLGSVLKASKHLLLLQTIK